MQVNKNGIPVHTPKKAHQGERPNFELGQVKYISTVEGVEVSIILPDFSPIKKLARSFGWVKVDYEDR